MTEQKLKWGKDGLIPAIAQDARTGEVLMLAYMNRESLDRTLTEGRAWYWSRSRQKLWMKGEESGNFQKVVEVYFDCDADTLLLKVIPAGPSCHTGTNTCFVDRKIPLKLKKGNRE